MSQMNILDEIIACKQREVAQNRSLYPTALLEKSIYFETPPVSLKHYLTREDKTGIIAEFKRKSPSKGMINAHARVEYVSIGYMQAGSSGLSILTDREYFGGANADLTEARKFNFCPILRKEFVVDEYQIVEAKSIGADAILLIAECLTKDRIARFVQVAHDLGMEVLIELHSEDQIDKIPPDVDVIGVNNRDLRSFRADLTTSANLAAKLPSGIVWMSESGIHNPTDILNLSELGYSGFLIGEKFMSSSDPPAACHQFVQQLNRLKSDIRASVDD